MNTKKPSPLRKTTRKEKLQKAYVKLRSNPVLHVIFPDGKVESAPWKGKLECKAPPLDKMYELIGLSCVEHVSVLFAGKRMHMFVDEEFRLKNPVPKFNWKASALYANWALYQQSATAFLYGDLTAEPALTPEGYIDNGLDIHGVALLWEGELK